MAGPARPWGDVALSPLRELGGCAALRPVPQRQFVPPAFPSLPFPVLGEEDGR